MFSDRTSDAIRKDNFSAVVDELAAGVNPNQVSNRITLLSIAAIRGNLLIVNELIKAGVDLENRSGVGITPLMVAVQEKRTDIALNLLASGADVNTLNQFEEGVLNYAIYVKSPILINAVLDRGVDTQQLKKLFTTIDYDPPGIKNTPSHLEELCS